MVSYAEQSSEESESEDDFQEGLNFNETGNDNLELETVDNIRRRRSLDRDILQAGEALDASFVVQPTEGVSREHFSPVQVRFPVNAPEFRPPIMPPTVNYDQANTDNGEKAQDLARSVKVEFEPNDILFWFSQLEAEMLMATIGKQWLKKTVLQRNLPNKQKEDVKAYLILSETDAGNKIYYEIKQELIRMYAPKAKDSYCKALTRTMTGLPSQLGLQIVNDVCKKANKLKDCCCSGAVEAIWQLQLPANIRGHISNMEFSHSTYKKVFEAADEFHLSSKQVTVAAMTAKSAELNETLPAFDAHNVQQVAAIRGGRGGGNGSARGGNRGNKRGNRGRGGANTRRPPRHASQPPESCCDRHYQHGDQAFYCLKPLTCPWVKKVVAPQ